MINIQSITYGSWERDSGMELIERKRNYGAAMADGDGMQSFNFISNGLLFRDAVIIEW